MTTEEFTIWLKEFMEKSPKKVFTIKEVKAIKDKMKTVKEYKGNKTGIILSC